MTSYIVTIPNPERFVFLSHPFLRGHNGSSNQDSIGETGFMLHTLMKIYWKSKMLKLTGQVEHDNDNDDDEKDEQNNDDA